METESLADDAPMGRHVAPAVNMGRRLGSGAATFGSMSFDRAIDPEIDPLATWILTFSLDITPSTLAKQVLCAWYVVPSAGWRLHRIVHGRQVGRADGAPAVAVRAVQIAAKGAPAKHHRAAQRDHA